MTMQYDCTIGIPKNKATEFIRSMIDKDPDAFGETDQWYAFVSSSGFVVFTIYGNRVNQSEEWHNMTKWCADNLDDEDWSAAELCTEYLYVGGSGGDEIFSVMATTSSEHKYYYNINSLIDALNE